MSIRPGPSPNGKDSLHPIAKEVMVINR